MRTPIFQFGTSRFFQAHADLFLSQSGGPASKVSVIASSGSPIGKSRLSALAGENGYPVIIRGLESGQPVERRITVTSVVRSYDAERDWLKLVDDFSVEAEFVISNTTERGFYVPEHYEPDLAEMLVQAPAWYPAKLLALLLAAYCSKRNGLVILPTELVGRNGDMLKAIVMSLAKAANGERAFLDWLNRDCVFANSLVDRIVSEPIEPAGAVAEPYALWAIEKQKGLRLPCTHDAIRIVDDLQLFERLKIHILNLGHTVLAEQWIVEGSNPEITVRAMMNSERHVTMLKELYANEVIPGFIGRNMGCESAKYLDVTLERFANPFLNHRISDIATGHEEKVRRRIVGFLEWASPSAKTPVLSAIAAKYIKD